MKKVLFGLIFLLLVSSVVASGNFFNSKKGCPHADKFDFKDKSNCPFAKSGGCTVGECNKTNFDHGLNKDFRVKGFFSRMFGSFPFFGKHHIEKYNVSESHGCGYLE